MSNIKSWDACPPEILCIIFKNADSRTLINCMQVSLTWRNAAYYIAKRRSGGLKKIIEKTFVKTFTRKTKERNYSFINSLLWYKISKAEINFDAQIWRSDLQHVSIYKDNIILATGLGVFYYDIDTFRCKNHLKFFCDQFEESDCMIVLLTYSWPRPPYETFIKVYAKTYNGSIERGKPCICKVKFYKLYENRCYVLLTKGNIIVLSTTKYPMDDKHVIPERLICRYFGNMLDVTGMHVCPKRYLYLLLRNCVILRTNTNRVDSLKFYFSYDMPLNIIDPTPMGTFQGFGAVFAADSCGDFVIECYGKDQFILIKCPGLTCVTDHGDMLILGHNRSKISFFVKSNLRNAKVTTERTIDITNYCEFNPPFPKILGIDVYEDSGKQKLFVTTDSVVLMLEICYAETKDSDLDTEQTDEFILSNVHLFSKLTQVKPFMYLE